MLTISFAGDFCIPDKMLRQLSDKFNGMRGAWVAKSVKCPILAFASGYDLGVMGLNPTLGSMLSPKSAGPSPSVPPLH